MRLANSLNELNPGVEGLYLSLCRGHLRGGNGFSYIAGGDLGLLYQHHPSGREQFEGCGCGRCPLLLGRIDDYEVQRER
tara:strand:+ start:322 stop:558 length:237 start_codon:yes stop_codon:yes gene_type:complete